MSKFFTNAIFKLVFPIVIGMIPLGVFGYVFFTQEDVQCVQQSEYSALHVLELVETDSEIEKTDISFHVFHNMPKEYNVSFYFNDGLFIEGDFATNDDVYLILSSKDDSKIHPFSINGNNDIQRRVEEDMHPYPFTFYVNPNEIESRRYEISFYINGNHYETSYYVDFSK